MSDGWRSGASVDQNSHIGQRRGSNIVMIARQTSTKLGKYTLGRLRLGEAPHPDLFVCFCMLTMSSGRPQILFVTCAGISEFMGTTGIIVLGLSGSYQARLPGTGLAGTRE